MSTNIRDLTADELREMIAELQEIIDKPLSKMLTSGDLDWQRAAIKLQKRLKARLATLEKEGP